MAFQFSPSAGCKISVNINGNMTEIKGAEGIPEFGSEKGTYDITAIADTAKSFGSDMPDYGETTLTGMWDSTDPGQAHLLTSAGNAAAIDEFQVDYVKKQSANTAAKAVFQGLVLSFRVAAAKGGPQRFTSRVKLTGAVNWTAQA